MFPAAEFRAGNFHHPRVLLTMNTHLLLQGQAQACVYTPTHIHKHMGVHTQTGVYTHTWVCTHTHGCATWQLEGAAFTTDYFFSYNFVCTWNHVPCALFAPGPAQSAASVRSISIIVHTLVLSFSLTCNIQLNKCTTLRSALAGRPFLVCGYRDQNCWCLLAFSVEVLRVPVFHSV